MKSIVFTTLTTFLATLTTPVAAQQQPIFTLYREQNGVINPAMPSVNYTINDYRNTISATYRYQWFNVPEAPVTQVVSWESLLDDKNLLVGAYAVNDKTGDIGFTNFYGRCAYRLMFSEMDKRFLSIGLSVGASRFHTAIAQFNTDPSEIVVDKNQVSPDLNFGAYYNHGKQFYVGISAPQLLGTTHVLETKTEKQVRIKRPQHIYAMAGYFFDAPFFGNDVAYLEPNTWLRYLPITNTLSLDLGLRAKISQTFWTATSYNLTAKTLNIELGSTLGESIGFDTGELRIGLGFLVPLGNLATLGGGGEIHLSYAWSR